MNNQLILKRKVEYFGIDIYNFNINDKENIEILKNLLNEYLVVVIKNIQLSHEEQIKLISFFGTPTIAHPVIPGNNLYPEILEVDSSKGGKNAKWHTDVSFLEKPHAVSVLICDEIPEFGGDTLWLDLRTAYEKINSEFKFFLNKLEAVHKITPLAYWGQPNDLSFSKEMATQLYEDSKKINPVSHPVVRIHPITKIPSLFINPGYTSHILNLSQIESDNILKLLYEHCTQPEFTLRHKWEKNDIVIWDNRNTAHYAVNDYGNNFRKMRRVTSEGEIPIGYNNLKSKKMENLFEIIR
jgi:taurine dioxygenase